MAIMMTKEEMQKKIEELEATNAALTAEREKQEVINNDPNRRVKIKLFKDNDRYSQPYSVSVNDYNAVIQRGIEVEVPYYVAKHLEEIAAQDAATAMMIGKLTADWSDKARALA